MNDLPIIEPKICLYTLCTRDLIGHVEVYCSKQCMKLERSRRAQKVRDNEKLTDEY